MVDARILLNNMKSFPSKCQKAWAFNVIPSDGKILYLLIALFPN